MKRIDHVQVAIPPGGEDAARSFYVDVIGFAEVDKPPALRSRGGLWLKLDDIELHLGIQEGFVAAGKAHPGFGWDHLDELAERLAGAGWPTEWDDAIAGRRRFYTVDPFGNRLEFLTDQPAN